LRNHPAKPKKDDKPKDKNKPKTISFR